MVIENLRNQKCQKKRQNDLLENVSNGVSLDFV